MALWLLLSLQFAATALGLGFLWRRQRRLSDEVARLRQSLAAVEAGAATRKRGRVAQRGAAPAEAEIVTIAATVETPAARAARTWRPPPGGFRFDAAAVATMRGLALGAAAAAAGLGVLVGVDAIVMVAVGLGVAAAMMFAGLRSTWRAASWTGVLTAGAWTFIGLALGAAHAAPIVFTVFTTLAGLAGLAHASLRRPAAGSLMALTMAVMLIALGSQTSMIGPAGGGFGVLVAAAAIVGATNLRLEPIVFAAFAASLVGLFVLSGQEAAAIWFTPATAWSGALFLAIAAVRVPQLAARGLALAGLGALAPLLALGALYSAQHGIADHTIAAAAFLVLGVVFCGLIAISALRRATGLAALKLTLWVLAAAAFAAFSAAISLAAPSPVAATAFAALTLALAELNRRFPHAAWRALACAGAATAAAFALSSAHMALNEAPNWPAWALVALGMAAPAGLLAASATLARRADAAFPAAAFDVGALIMGVMGVDVVLRLLFSAGAPLLQPVGFVEAGAHAAAWLTASLLIAWRASDGSTRARLGVAAALLILALVVSVFSGGLWLTSYWTARAGGSAIQAHAPFGFLAPAVLFWAHWAYWRINGAPARARVSLAAAAMLSAAFITLEALHWPGTAEWIGALVGAVAFALAIIVNFTPAFSGERRLDREKYFHGDRRRQQRV